MNNPPIAQILTTIINKWNLINLKIFYMARDTIICTKCQPIKWEKISNT